MPINTSSQNFIALRDRLNAYLEESKKKLSKSNDAVYGTVETFKQRKSELESNPFSMTPDTTVFYSSVSAMTNLWQVFEYVFDLDNTKSDLVNQSRYEAYYPVTVTNKATGQPVTDVRVPLAKEMPSNITAQITAAAQNGFDLQTAIDETDNVRRYILYGFLLNNSTEYAQYAVDYIIKNNKKDDIAKWTVSNIDSAVTAQALEIIGWNLLLYPDFFGSSVPCILESNPWAGTDLLLQVVKDELGIVTAAVPVTCDENGCRGIYVGPEFDKKGSDVAHKFSNTMCNSVGDKLKELYKAGKYVRVDFSKIVMITRDMGKTGKNPDGSTGKVEYSLDIPFTKVSAKCDAYTSFDHVGGWNHTPELEKRKKSLASALIQGDELAISPLLKTPEGLQEYWLQWRNKVVQKDCKGVKFTDADPTPTGNGSTGSSGSNGSKGSEGVDGTQQPTEEPIKFKLTVSSTVSKWEQPKFDPDNIKARNDLDPFYLFIGDEAPDAGDPFSDFEENDYDQLDPEYVEESAEGLSQEEYDLAKSVSIEYNISVDQAAQAIYGGYDKGGAEDGDTGGPANPSITEGWSGNVRWGMKVKKINLTVAGRTTEVSIWNCQVVGGDKRYNLLKAYTAGGESKNSYCSYSWGNSGNSLSESVFGFNNDGSPRTSKYPKKSPLGSSCITSFTWNQLGQKGLYVSKPGIFAVGKYQNLISYIRKHVASGVLNGDSYASPQDQEKLGEMTIKAWSNLYNYVRGNNKGTQNDLKLAIYDSAQCWASLPTTKRGHSVETNPGYNGAVYGGKGQNPSKVLKNIGQSAIVFIETRKAFTGKDPDWLPSWYKPLGINFQDF